jgi:hypothetical protein
MRSLLDLQKPGQAVQPLPRQVQLQPKDAAAKLVVESTAGTA